MTKQYYKTMLRDYPDILNADELMKLLKISKKTAYKLLKENRKVGMYPISEDSFLDMGEFEEMHRMEKKLDLKSE